MSACSHPLVSIHSPCFRADLGVPSGLTDLLPFVETLFPAVFWPASCRHVIRYATPSLAKVMTPAQAKPQTWMLTLPVSALGKANSHSIWRGIQCWGSQNMALRANQNCSASRRPFVEIHRTVFIRVENDVLAASILVSVEQSSNDLAVRFCYNNVRVQNGTCSPIESHSSFFVLIFRWALAQRANSSCGLIALHSFSSSSSSSLNCFCRLTSVADPVGSRL